MCGAFYKYTMGLCQNSPFYGVTLVTDNCSEGDFLFIRVLTQPHVYNVIRIIISRTVL